MTNSGNFQTSLNQQDSDNSLWHYACQQYKQAEVKNICLALQDRFGADVNVLLTAGWAATQGFAPDWPPLLEETTSWQAKIVEPLRAVRRQLDKTSVLEQSLYTALCRLEIDAEKLELAYLYKKLTRHSRRLCGPRASGAELSCNNITSYLNYLISKNPVKAEHQSILQHAEVLNYHLCKSYLPQAATTIPNPQQR